MSAYDRAMTFLQRLDSVFNTITGMGGSRDKGEAVTVNTSERTFAGPERDALARKDGYLSSWFDRVGDETVLTGWDLKTGAAYITAFRDDDERLMLQDRMSEAVRVAFKDGGALIMMVTDDGLPLSEPLDMARVTQLQAIHVFEGQEFEAYAWNNDIRDPNWRHVDLWALNPQVGSDPRRGAVPIGERHVHHTRCLYIPGRRLWARKRIEFQGKDDPMAVPVWDGLKDMRQVDQGGAILAQEMKESTIKLGGLNAANASVMADELIERVSLMARSKGILGSIVLGEDDEYHSQMASATGYKDLKSGAQSTWAALTGQPQTIAFGATPGGLNTDGESGRKAWDRRLHAYQKTHLLAPLRRYYRVLITAAGNRGEEVPDRWDVVFRHLGTLTLQEEASVRNTNAQTDRINVQIGALTPEYIRRARFGPDGYQHDLPPFEGAEGPPSPERALAGPQASALREIVLAVATKTLPRESAIAMIRHGFHMTPEQADDILGPVGAGFYAEPPPAPVGAPPPKAKPSDGGLDSGPAAK